MGLLRLLLSVTEVLRCEYSQSWFCVATRVNVSIRPHRIPTPKACPAAQAKKMMFGETWASRGILHFARISHLAELCASPWTPPPARHRIRLLFASHRALRCTLARACTDPLRNAAVFAAGSRTGSRSPSANDIGVFNSTCSLKIRKRSIKRRCRDALMAPLHSPIRTGPHPLWPCIGCVAKGSFLSGGSLLWAFLFSKSGALSCRTEFVLRAGAAAAGNMRGASRACPHRIVGRSGAQEAH